MSEKESCLTNLLDCPNEVILYIHKMGSSWFVSRNLMLLNRRMYKLLDPKSETGEVFWRKLAHHIGVPILTKMCISYFSVLYALFTEECSKCWIHCTAEPIWGIGPYRLCPRCFNALQPVEYGRLPEVMQTLLTGLKYESCHDEYKKYHFGFQLIRARALFQQFLCENALPSTTAFQVEMKNLMCTKRNQRHRQITDFFVDNLGVDKRLLRDIDYYQTWVRSDTIQPLVQSEMDTIRSYMESNILQINKEVVNKRAKSDFLMVTKIAANHVNRHVFEEVHSEKLMTLEDCDELLRSLTSKVKTAHPNAFISSRIKRKY